MKKPVKRKKLAPGISNLRWRVTLLEDSRKDAGAALYRFEQRLLELERIIGIWTPIVDMMPSNMREVVDALARRMIVLEDKKRKRR